MIPVRRFAIVSALVALSLAASARASELFSPALRVDDLAVVVCSAVHFGSQQDLLVEIFDAQSTSLLPVASLNCPNERPGLACDTAITNPGVSKFFFCKVTAARKSTVRAAIVNLETGATLEAR